MKENKLNLVVVFGGKSPEHEVSIVTTFQAWEWISPQKYSRFLIYLDYQNRAFLCPSLKKIDYRHFINKVLNQKRSIVFTHKGIKIQKGLIRKEIPIDVVLLLTHGGSGENGQIQGLFDFLGLPYTGSGVLGSALGMDKIITKEIFAKIDLETIPFIWFYVKEFKSGPKKIIKKIETKLKYPLFVKPASGGSSVGISKVKTRKQLIKAVRLVSQFDQKILLEESIENSVDINCAVMGGYRPITSVCEQPISEDQFLSFKEKYLKGGKNKGMAGLSRIIPAPVPEKISQKIQKMAKIIFRSLNIWGMARVDFLYQKKTGKVYPNEINTIPGSLAFYLWKASGIEPNQLIDKMVNLVLERKKEFDKLNYFFKSKILDQSQK